jgi:hypothetical protein
VRKLTALLSVVLLALVSIALAEAALVSLLFLFGVILKLYLTIWVGPQGIQTTLQWPSSLGLQVTVYTAGTVGSLLVTAAGGAIAAGWRYRRWRPLS